MGSVRQTYRSFKKKLKLYFSVNWYATWRFNLKMFPFATARKLPVIFYGKIKFSNLEGKLIIDAPIKRGMIGFGQSFEFPTTSKGTAELYLQGTMICKGHVQIGKDVGIKVLKDAVLKMGHMACLGSNARVICTNKIELGDNARVGYQTQFIDTTIHQLVNIHTNEKLPMSAPIFINTNNWIGNRTTIMKGTHTAVNCITASNSLLNKDYTSFGEDVIIGGIPAKLLKQHIRRDWEGERKKMEKNLIIF